MVVECEGREAFYNLSKSQSFSLCLRGWLLQVLLSSLLLTFSSTPGYSAPDLFETWNPVDYIFTYLGEIGSLKPSPVGQISLYL